MRSSPPWVTLHRDFVPPADRQWYGAVPVTTVARTLIDLAAHGFDADLFEQALDQARSRGHVPVAFERTILRELIKRRMKDA